MRFKEFTPKALTYSAICIALATILSVVKLFEMPQGGTVTAFSMMFVTMSGYFFGLRVGITAAVAHGLLQLIFGPTIVHPVQLIMDYPLAFGMLGLSGLFNEKKYGLQAGYLIGVLGRLFFSTVSGVVFFGEYAPVGDNVIIYSLIYNLSYIAPEAAVTLILFSIPTVGVMISRVREQALA